jgi:hypothetical protein
LLWLNSLYFSHNIVIVTEQNHDRHGLGVTAVRPEDDAGLQTAMPRITVLYVHVQHGALRYFTLCANCAAHRRVWYPVVMALSSGTWIAAGCM